MALVCNRLYSYLIVVKTRVLIARLSIPMLALLLTCHNATAQNSYEVALGAHKLALDIVEKTGISEEDNGNASSIGLAVYRSPKGKHRWGGALEVNIASSRDQDFGTGRLLVISPVLYRYQWSDWLALGAQAGIAQYDWVQNANGYIFGVNITFSIKSLPIKVNVSSKYFQDLSYDSGNGDIIVDGYKTGVELIYTF